MEVQKRRRAARSWKDLRVGIDPWAPRLTGKARWWTRRDLPDWLVTLIEEGYGEQDNALHSLSFSLPGMRHVDGIDLAEYRGTRAYIVEQLDPWGETFYAWKSWQDYGYCVPSPLSCDDVSPEYFNSGGTEVMLVYVPLCLETNPPTALSRFIAEEVQARQADPQYESEWEGATQVDLSVFPADYYAMLGEQGSLKPEWVRSKHMPSWMELRDVNANDCGDESDESAPPVGLMAELDACYARVRKRRAWYIRFTESCVFYSCTRWFGVPRDISNLISGHVIRLPDPNIATLEKSCSDCSAYLGLTPVDCDSSAGFTPCALCGKILCWSDGDCTVASHSVTHRHLSRMRFESSFEVGADEVP